MSTKRILSVLRGRIFCWIFWLTAMTSPFILERTPVWSRLPYTGTAVPRMGCGSWSKCRRRRGAEESRVAGDDEGGPRVAELVLDRDFVEDVVDFLGVLRPYAIAVDQVGGALEGGLALGVFGLVEEGDVVDALLDDAAEVEVVAADGEGDGLRFCFFEVLDLVVDVFEDVAGAGFELEVLDFDLG
ncbi:uncharacterized protein BDZ99DRAFT_466214, partial [Mytilinidion resinicola]